MKKSKKSPCLVKNKKLKTRQGFSNYFIIKYMRPKIKRCLRFRPNVYYFKPQGIPLRALGEIILQADELEALKLYEIDGLEQIEASKKMKISQPTFARLLGSAHKKVSEAIIKGKAIKIEKGGEKNDI